MRRKIKSICRGKISCFKRPIPQICGYNFRTLQKEYSNIIANADIVSKHNFTLPETLSVRLEDNGTEYTNHLFAAENGFAKIKLNSWEAGVLEEEAAAEDFVCWIRNPSRSS